MYHVFNIQTKANILNSLNLYLKEKETSFRTYFYVLLILTNGLTFVLFHLILKSNFSNQISVNIILCICKCKKHNIHYESLRMIIAKLQSIITVSC